MHIIYIFVLQLALCCVTTLVGTIWNQTKGPNAWYLGLLEDTNPFNVYWYLNAVQRFGSWILLFTY